MNKMTAFATAFGLALVTQATTGPGAVAAVIRSTHDVTCKLTVKSGAAAQTGSGVTTKLVVKNRSRERAPNVQVAIFANAPVGTPLWTGTLDLKAHHGKTRHVHVDVPAGTTSLIAVATSDDDDNPGNNISGVEVHGGDDGAEGGDDGGGTTTTPPTTTPPTVPPAADAAVMAGAATFATNCASCHGADAKGTRSGPRILGKSAHDVLEAMREGEDSMPRFPNMTATDASNIAAFLKNPAAATQPTTPVTPPTNGAAPTYSGQIQTLLQANCVVCHTGQFAAGPASGPIQLDSYATASANASAALTAMQNGIMPPGGPLPASSVQLFSDWINGGKQQ